MSTFCPQMQRCSVQITAPNRRPTAIWSDESSRRLPIVATGGADSHAADSMLDAANKRDRLMTLAFSRIDSAFWAVWIFVHAACFLQFASAGEAISPVLFCHVLLKFASFPLKRLSGTIIETRSADDATDAICWHGHVRRFLDAQASQNRRL